MRHGELIAAVPFVQAPSPTARDATSLHHQARNRAQPPRPLAAARRLTSRRTEPGRRGGCVRRSAPCPPRPHAQGETSGATCCAGLPRGRRPAALAKTATRHAARTHLSKSKQLAGRRAVVFSGQQTLSPRTDRESSVKVPGVLDGRRAPRRRARATPRRARLTSTTEPLTKVHARSGTLVLDPTDGRAPGVDGV